MKCSNIIILMPLILFLAACQTGLPRDSSGTPMKLDAWKELSLDDTDLNVAELMPVKITSAEWRMRNNELIHERFKLEGNKGVFFEERIMSQTTYSDVTEDTLRNPDYLRKIFKFKGDLKTHPIKRDDLIGALGHYGISNSPKKCLFAHIGYKFNGNAPYARLQDNVDTIIMFRYCDPDVTYKQFSKLFDELQRIEK